MPKTPEKCRTQRDEMRSRILQRSMLYFARNGFAGTKISDLAKHIGIGQGTMYIYFESKEALFAEISHLIQYDKELKELSFLVKLPISAKRKISLLSDSVIKMLAQDELSAARVTLYAQIYLEEGANTSENAMYSTDLYKFTVEIVEQGQKEGTFISGSPQKLADLYWGVVYLYSLKKLFTSEFVMITASDLERIVVHD